MIEYAKYAKLLNVLFSNLIENLKILEFKEVKALAEKISHSILKAILKIY